MQRYNFIVLTNPVEGREDEYNDWYTNTHLPDVLKIPGIVAAQRFTRAAIQRGAGPFPWKYLAIYECESDNLSGIVRELTARGGTELMRMTDALAEERFACFFEPITSRHQAQA